MKCSRWLLLVLVLIGVAGQEARGITCPGGGAKVKVVIDNPTGMINQPITISGERITAERTCDGGGAAASYSQVVNLYQSGTNEWIVPASGGVSTGMWRHHISTDVGGNQHQQGVVLRPMNPPNDYTTVRWTYHPAVITVNATGDAGVGLCNASSCTLRQALDLLNGLVTTQPAFLIQFTVSPGTMTQTTDLVVGSNTASPIITIDGTDSDGNSWIVGDALAAAQNNQDSFPVVVDLNNRTKFRINGHNVTIKGLAINNTVPTGNPAKILIEGGTNNTRIDAVRLDGGATGTSSAGATSHLIHFTAGSGSQVVNVEGRAAFGDGVRAQNASGSLHQVRDSWFHHNYANNVVGDRVQISRNTIELGGRKSDNVIVNSFAIGIKGINLSELDTARNLVRNHTSHGSRSPPLRLA